MLCVPALVRMDEIVEWLRMCSLGWLISHTLHVTTGAYKFSDCYSWQEGISVVMNYKFLASLLICQMKMISQMFVLFAEECNKNVENFFKQLFQLLLVMLLRFGMFYFCLLFVGSFYILDCVCLFALYAGNYEGLYFSLRSDYAWYSLRSCMLLGLETCLRLSSCR